MNIGDLVDLRAALAEDGWISSFAKVSRPLAVTLTVAIPAIGGLSVGLATIADAKLGADMAANCVAFFAGLPEALYWMVGGIATGYFGAKAWETRSPTPPEGRPSPEGPTAPIATPAIDEAIQDALDPASPDPTMRDSDIDGRDHAAVQDTPTAAFDEDADPAPIGFANVTSRDQAERLARRMGATFVPRTDLPVPLFGGEDVFRDGGSWLDEDPATPFPAPGVYSADQVRGSDAAQLTGAQFETKELVL